MVYLDHNATTPLDPRVLEAMLPYLSQFHGNPSSLYRLGRLSRQAVDTAREQVAALLGAHPTEVIFTSGGTEANNLAIKGSLALRPPGRILVGATEHPAVSEPTGQLRAMGWAIDVIPVDGNGEIAIFQLAPLLDRPFQFASVMLANNETGVINNPAKITDAAQVFGAIVHCDAVQAAGKIPLDFRASGADLMSVSSHKIYGPKGVGALVARDSAKLEPLIAGGGQESGQRGGTENVAGIVGFGKAAELALTELAERTSRIRALRERLERGLGNVAGSVIFARDAERLPNTVQFGLSGFDGEALVMALDRAGFAVSSGSACTSGAGEPSPVLTAMGYAGDAAKSGIRVSLGKDNSEQHIDRLLDQLARLTGNDTRSSGGFALPRSLSTHFD